MLFTFDCKYMIYIPSYGLQLINFFIQNKN